MKLKLAVFAFLAGLSMCKAYGKEERAALQQRRPTILHFAGYDIFQSTEDYVPVRLHSIFPEQPLPSREEGDSVERSFPRQRESKQVGLEGMPYKMMSATSEGPSSSGNPRGKARDLIAEHEEEAGNILQRSKAGGGLLSDSFGKGVESGRGWLADSVFEENRRKMRERQLAAEKTDSEPAHWPAPVRSAIRRLTDSDGQRGIDFERKPAQWPFNNSRRTETLTLEPIKPAGEAGSRRTVNANPLGPAETDNGGAINAINLAPTRELSTPWRDETMGERKSGTAASSQESNTDLFGEKSSDSRARNIPFTEFAPDFDSAVRKGFLPASGQETVKPESPRRSNPLFPR